MAGSVKIALQLPTPTALKSTFSIRLKKELIKEAGVFYPSARVFLLNGSSGNFSDMMSAMLHYNIIDEYFNWNFADGHVIITGNCLNGSPESVALLWLIYSLESKAQKKGGYIHFLPGHSELMNTQGEWRSLQPAYAPGSINSIHRYAVLFDGNNELYRWLLTKNIVEKIGEMAVLQCNLPQESRHFLPKFPGKRFPEGVLDILQHRLDEINEEYLAFIHKALQVAVLVITEANTGKVIVSDREAACIYSCEAPVLICDENGMLNKKMLAKNTQVDHPLALKNYSEPI